MPQATAVLAASLAVASLAAVALHPARRAPRVLGWVFVIALCAMVVSCLAGCASSFVDAPPKRFQGPGLYTVRTVATADIAKVCAGGSSIGERQGSVVGCTKGSVIILPNPAEWSDPYSQLFAHEAGHRNGWPDNHTR